jgi:hypothetical protein
VKPKVNIIALVDVIGALSAQTLGDGNLSLVDDGEFDSAGQGTPGLCTLVQAGQVVEWSALAVDVQTPLVIRSIAFLGPDGTAAFGPASPAAGDGPSPDGQQYPDAMVWSGVVPFTLASGVPYRYRLELQMDQGEQSVLSIDAPALMCL